MKAIIFVIFLIFAVSFVSIAYGTSVKLKNFENDLVAPFGIVVNIYQDDSKKLFRTIEPQQNPFVITDLPNNHQYSFEVIKNGIIATKTPLTTINSDVLEIFIPNEGGVKFKIRYNDNSEISGATVLVKSLDNKIWVNTKTSDTGETGRFWLQATNDESYYYSEILLEDDISFIYSPVHIPSGLPIDLDVKTPWPKQIDFIKVRVYKDNHLANNYDGEFFVELYNSDNQKISSVSVNKGNALFTLVPVGKYQFKVWHKPIGSDSFQIYSTYNTIITKNTSIDIFEQDILDKTKQNCKCVAFRLDDVQDYFLNKPQMAVIETFRQKNIPLTLGIIGGLIGSDSDLISLIKQGILDQTLEVANHSWNNSPITVYNKTQQEQLIKDANKMIFDIFGVSPKVFIPPENVFDTSTIEILKTNNFTHLSSSLNYDYPPFELSNSTFYRFPKVAQTAILDSNSNIWINENRTKIFSDIQNAMNNYGFAVVMMHPPDFAINDKGIYKNQVNQKMINELEMLIDDITNAGYSIVPISQINLDSEHIENVKKTHSSISTKPNCNCVAIRVDGVQDFWLNKVQNTLIDTLEQNNASFTLGIIGKFFGDDPMITSKINSTLRNNRVDVNLANMGWEFVDHSQFGITEQSASIAKTNERIRQLFGIYPKIFIPPFGQYDDNTVLALKQNNIVYLSSDTQKDKSNLALKSDISHIPYTVSATELLEDDPFLQGTISQKALKKIHSNLEQYGFAVISIMPTDIAIKENQNFQNTVDQTKLQTFTDILSAIKNDSLDFVTLDKIPEILWSKSLTIPSWIKNNAKWWSEKQIADSDFVSGIEYMIQNQIIIIPNLPDSESSEAMIPSWIRNNAKWWANGMISDADFVNGIEYLVKKGIIRVR